GKMGIGGKEVFGLALDVGEVAPPAPRNQDLLTRPFRALQNSHTTTALACLGSAKQPGRSRSQNDYVKSPAHEWRAIVAGSWIGRLEGQRPSLVERRDLKYLVKRTVKDGLAKAACRTPLPTGRPLSACTWETA